jgi:hypothetical protein
MHCFNLGVAGTIKNLTGLTCYSSCWLLIAISIVVIGHWWMELMQFALAWLMGWLSSHIISWGIHIILL